MMAVSFVIWDVAKEKFIDISKKPNKYRTHQQKNKILSEKY